MPSGDGTARPQHPAPPRAHGRAVSACKLSEQLYYNSQMLKLLVAGDRTPPPPLSPLATSRKGRQPGGLQTSINELLVMHNVDHCASVCSVTISETVAR